MQARVWSLDGLGEPPDAQKNEDKSEAQEQEALRPELGWPHPPKQDTSQYPQIIRERQDRTQPLRRGRHCLAREHEPRQEDVREEEEEAELHGLGLSLDRGGDQ